ncbi:hypothetical protein LAZ67_4003129 [Cordylochernes scorpioides]|uniref:Uncharacterized protein n=1 Tax=Cordylochernes scorpioides TaxID=51811 RepID=A0ABY6KDD8_9ARAC|nr:hypothetical protein LAZ67_4003129 [Cordylochernes scorpioides]
MHANPAAARGDVTAPKTAATISATPASPASLNWADSEMAEVNDNEGFIVVKGKKRRLGSTSPEHAARQPNKPGNQRSSQQQKRPTGPRAVPPKQIKATRANIADARARQATTNHENYIFVELSRPWSGRRLYRREDQKEAPRICELAYSGCTFSNIGSARTSRRPQSSAGSVPRAQEVRTTRAHITEARARQASSSEDHCIYLEHGPELQPFHYLRALDRMLGGTAGVIQVSKVNGHQLLGLANRGLAERLINEGLEVEGTLLRAFPFRKRAERITVGNLPFFVEDSAISAP